MGTPADSPASPRGNAAAAPGDIWLGDALRVAQALGLLHGDDEQRSQLRQVVQCLGLLAADGPAQAERRGRASNPGGAASGGDTKLADEDSAQAVADAPPPAAAAPAQGDAGTDKRLPSLLHPRAAVPVRPPAWLAGAATLPAQEPPPPRRAPPLLPPLSRRAVLSAALATLAEDGAPDMPRIVHALSRGSLLQRLPRQRRRTLRRGVQVQVDAAPWMAPFAADQRELLSYLARLLPAGRLQRVRIEGQPHLDAPGASDAPVLLLTDLGIGHQPQALAPASPQEWAQFARAMQRQRRHAVALVPYAPWRWPRLGLPAGAQAGLRPLHWHEGLKLTDLQRAGPAPARSLPAGGELQQDTLALATALSPALQASPWLLRMARRGLRLDAGCEADLWLSTLVQSAGEGGLALQPAVAADLRLLLAESPQRPAALALLAQAHRHAPATQKIEEALVRLELRGALSEARVQRLLRPALKTLAEGLAADGAGATQDAAQQATQEAAREAADEVAVWAAHAWGRFSPAVQACAAPRQLAFAAAARLETRSWLQHEGGRRPALPADAGWLLASSSLPRRAFSLQLRRYGDGSVNLVIGPAEAVTNALHRIELPDTQPLWLQVGQWPDRSTAGPDDYTADWQTVLLAPDGPTQVDLAEPVAGGEVTLRDASGQEWRLDPMPALQDVVARSLFLPAGDARLPCIVLGQLQALYFADEAASSAPPRFYHPRTGGDLPWTDLGRVLKERFSLGAERYTQLHVMRPVSVSLGTDSQPTRWAALDTMLCAPARTAGTTHWYVPLLQSGAGQPVALWRQSQYRDPGPGLSVAKFSVVEGAEGDFNPQAAESSDSTGPAGDAAPVPAYLAWPVPGLLAPCDGSAWSLVLNVNPPSAKDVYVELLMHDMPTLSELAQQVAQAHPSPLAAQLADAIVPKPLPSPSLATSVRSTFARWMERMDPAELGLFRVDFERPDKPGGMRLVSAEDLKYVEGPMLLFIHGTFGNTNDAFGALLNRPSPEREQLQRRYGPHIYSWHYRSVTEGPVRNALALLRVLPPRMRLDIVGLSAGGIQAELLCLLQRPQASLLDRALYELAPLGGDGQSLGAELRALRNHLVHGEDRGIEVERFVRVACPAGGTTAYERGQDRAFGMLKMLPIIGTPLSWTPGLDRLLTDPKASPGFSEMSPTAEIPRLLNAGLSVPGRLVVVAGVARRAGLMGRLGRSLTRFALGHADERDDLLVPLQSALAGLEREAGVDYWVDEGEDVSHFNYFINERSRRAIVAALLSESTAPGFEHASSLAEARQRLQLADPPSAPSVVA